MREAKRSTNFFLFRWLSVTLSIFSVIILCLSVLAQNPTSAANDTNRQTCLTGLYPALCDLNRLNAADRRRAETARKQVNLQTCLAGQYPALCDHKLLSVQEQQATLESRKKVNLRTCLEGQYAALCDRTLLNRDELIQVEAVESKHRSKVDDFKMRLNRIRQTDLDIYALVIGRLNNHGIAGGFTLNSNQAALDCRESTHGFDSCTVEIGVDVKSHAEQPDTRTADVTVSCDTQIVVRSQQGQTTTESGDGSESLHIRAGGGDAATVEINLSLYPRYDDPIINARISSASCEVTSID